MAILKTTAQFIEEMFDRYPNIKVIGEYKGSKNTIEIGCGEGHTWLAIPGKLLGKDPNGYRCRICEKVGKSTKSVDEFNLEVSSRFGLEVVGKYINSTTRIAVRGPCSHEWDINPNSLLSKGSGSTCRVCTPVETVLLKPVDILHREIHALSPNTTIIGKYTGSNNLLEVRCNNGHTRDIVPNLFINRGVGLDCLDCRKKEISIEIQNKYNIILQTEYRGIKFGGTLSCNKGHTWEVPVMGNLLYYGSGSNCPVCSPGNISRGELGLREFIRKHYVGWVVYNDRSILNGLELDIVLPDIGLAFEYNGDYYHSEDQKDRNYHKNKTIQVTDFGYQLIHISEYLWKNNRSLVESRILSILGNNLKIHARLCVVKQIKFPKEFLITNHLQGAGSPTKYNYGLFFKEELIAVMTFNTPRFTNTQEWELVRFCSLQGVSIVGGASKLLKAFRREKAGTIVSYADLSWSLGGLYRSLGFSFMHNSEPNYTYHKGNNRLTRYQTQKHKLADMFPEIFKEELSEQEILKRAGYLRVYDSGSGVWVLE